MTAPSTPAALVDRLIGLHNLLADNPTAFVDDVIGEDELAVLKAAAALARPADGWVHVGWRNLIGGKWCYFDGTMDPREVHDNGKPLEKVYVSAQDRPNSPLGGWVLVPIEPTEEMVVSGFESEPDEFFSPREEWEKYEAMSGCRQAAHRARLCWAAMLAATPTPPASDTAASVQQGEG